MRILRNYILGDLFVNFISTLGLLSLLLVCGNVLSKMADLVINWGVNFSLLAQLFIYSTPFLFGFTIPTAALISVMLVFGKLSSGQEINAMKAGGINLWRLVMPVLLTATALSLGTFYINNNIAAHSHFKVRQITSEIGMKTPASILEEGVFIKQFKDIVLYIHRVNRESLKGIRIYQPQAEGSTRTIVAEKGQIITVPEESLVKLKLMNGMTAEPDPKNPHKFYKFKFDTFMIPLDLSNYKFNKPLRKKTKEKSIKELWGEYERILVEHEFKAHDLLAEINNRIAMSFATAIFVLLGIPLAIVTKRGEKSSSFAIALILTTVYWTLMLGVKSLATTGTLHSGIALYIPNVVFIITGIILMKRLLRY